MASASAQDVLALPSSISGQRIIEADVAFEPEREKKLTIEYHYEQERGDDVKFKLLPNNSPKGVYARFLVIRSDSKSPHVVSTSQFIPEEDCLVQIKGERKKDGFYQVTLGKKSQRSVNLANYISPPRSSSSSGSDEEKMS